MSNKRNPTATLMEYVDGLELFRDMSNDFPAQYIHTFLTVALHQGVSNKDIQEITGLSSASVSRGVRSLGPARYNLIASEVDPADGRNRILFLTEHGKSVLKELLGRIGCEEKIPEPTQSLRGYVSNEEVPPTYFAPEKKVYTKEEAS